MMTEAFSPNVTKKPSNVKLVTKITCRRQLRSCWKSDHYLSHTHTFHCMVHIFSLGVANAIPVFSLKAGDCCRYDWHNNTRGLLTHSTNKKHWNYRDGSLIPRPLLSGNEAKVLLPRGRPHPISQGKGSGGHRALSQLCWVSSLNSSLVPRPSSLSSCSVEGGGGRVWGRDYLNSEQANEIAQCQTSVDTSQWNTAMS